MSTEQNGTSLPAAEGATTADSQPTPVDGGPVVAPAPAAAPPEVKAKRKLPSSTTTTTVAANDGTDAGAKSDSEGSYQQAKRPRNAQRRHPRGVPWFTMLERLKQYRVKHGTLNVPRILPDDQKLASWVHYQRYLFHHKTIAEERKAALDALGFEWTIADSKVGTRVTWEQHLERLTAYKEKYGDCLVPYTYKEDKSLAYWVSRQRKDNNKNLLPADKVAKLDAIGFAWNPTLGRRWSKNKEQRSRATNWDGQFERLRACTEKSKNEGTDLKTLVEQDKSLEAWMKNQRYLYSVRRMSQERVEKLESIGFVWRIGISWNDYLVRLKNHLHNHGNFDNITDSKLKEWVNCQRISYSFRELPKDKVDQLNAINFTWESEEVAASQEEWKKVVESSKLSNTTPYSQYAPPVRPAGALADRKPPAKPMNYATQKPRGRAGVDEKMPALPGQDVDPSQEEMAKFLEEAAPADAKTQEYNIAIHLAGLAETEPGQKAGAAKDGTQEPVVVDGGAAPVQAKKPGKGKKGATAKEEEVELSAQEKNVKLREESIALREEQIRLREEKLQLRKEIETLGKEIESEDKGAAIADKKKELEEKVKTNQELIDAQTKEIKENEDKIQGLLAQHKDP